MLWLKSFFGGKETSDRKRQRDGLGDLARPDEPWCTVNIGEGSCVRRALGNSVADSARKAESPA